MNPSYMRCQAPQVKESRRSWLRTPRTTYSPFMAAVAPVKLVPVSLEPSPVIEAYKKDVDRTLLRENLKLTPAQRVEKMIRVLAFTEELRRAGGRR
jgi:hypothetical protein